MLLQKHQSRQAVSNEPNEVQPTFSYKETKIYQGDEACANVIHCTMLFIE